MKKALSIVIMLLLAMTISAQEEATPTDSTKAELEVVDMNRTFSVGGKALMCLRSNKAEKRNLQALEWTLKNDRIGDKNVVVLDVINARDNSTVAHQMWSDGAMVRMKVKNKKPVLYEIYDDMFSHLRIADVGNMWVILFYSEMLEQ